MAVDKKQTGDHESLMQDSELAQLMQSLKPIDLDAKSKSALKTRILASARVSDSSTPDENSTLGRKSTEILYSITPDKRQWKTLYPGVKICVLNQDKHARSMLVNIAPGGFLFPHQHNMDEESIILEGDAWMDEKEYLPEGSYQFVQAGKIHPLIYSENGCTVFVRGQISAQPKVTKQLFRHFAHKLTSKLGFTPKSK